MASRPRKTEADHGELFTLHRSRANNAPAATESFEQFGIRTAAVPTLVAVVGTRIVGAIGTPIADNTLWLESLTVAPDQLDQQIDQQLVRSAIEHGKRSLCTHVRCVVPSGDMPSIQFYESLGFEMAGDTQAHFVLRLD